MDRHVGDQGEVIANIPIKISAKAVFSKFSISPINDINFGSLLVNTSKKCQFTLENTGEFEFKYAIIKRPTAEQLQRMNMRAQAARARSKSRDGQESVQGSSVSKMTGAGGVGGTKSKPSCIDLNCTRPN